MPLTPSRAAVLAAVRDARYVALAVAGNSDVSLVLDIVMDAVSDGTERELAEVLTAMACGPLRVKPEKGDV